VFDFPALRLCVFAFVFLSGCAQAPTSELELAAHRVEDARAVDAAIFAPERLEQAEAALATARSLVESRDYRDSVHSAAEAVQHADEAFDESTLERSIAKRRVERCLNELQGLMAIARSRGAASVAADELAAFVTRYDAVKATADSGDLLTALEHGHLLEAELLAFEQRFRD
jgi:hypothetical protein